MTTQGHTWADAVTRVSTEPIPDDTVSDYNSADDSDSYIVKRNPKGRDKVKLDASGNCLDVPIAEQTEGTRSSVSTLEDVSAMPFQLRNERDKINDSDSITVRSVSRGGGGRGGGRVGGDRSGAGTGLDRGTRASRGLAPSGRWGLGLPLAGGSLNSLPDTDTENKSREEMNFNLMNDINKQERENSSYTNDRQIRSDQNLKLVVGRVSGRYGGRSRGRRGGSGSGSAYVNDGASIPLGGQYKYRESK